MIPLCASDVPPLSVIMDPAHPDKWLAVLGFSTDVFGGLELRTVEGDLHVSELMRSGWKIKIVGQDWKPCCKPK